MRPRPSLFGSMFVCWQRSSFLAAGTVGVPAVASFIRGLSLYLVSFPDPSASADSVAFAVSRWNATSATQDRTIGAAIA